MSNYKDIKGIDFENIVDTGSEGTKVAVGTTAQRGSLEGQIRFNSESNALEFRNGTGYTPINDSPSISTADVTEIESGAGGTETINITGDDFISGVNVKFVGSDASEVTADSVTRNSRTSLTASVTRSNFANASEPYDVVVVNPNGKTATLSDYINIDNPATWTTASGNVADINMDATGAHSTLVASDPDGDPVSYSLASGSLGGLSLSSGGVISGTPTNVAADTTYNFGVDATSNSKTINRSFNIIVRKVFVAGNQSHTNLDDMLQEMAGIDLAQSAGGSLTINGQALGNYEYYATTSNKSLSSGENMNTYFSNTKDTTSSLLYFGGDLTINSGLTFIPPVRKLFTAIYVAGNLVVNGSISMTSRGANHSGTGNSGGYTAPAAIRLRSNGETIPASGGGGAGRNTGGNNSDGSNGGTATRGTGGGGSGGHKYKNTSNNYGGGGGAAGTSFSGGAGGGGNDYFTQNGGDGVANGGSGGSNGGGAQGGAGNPTVAGHGNQPLPEGTGGNLIIYCEGSVSGSGSLRARANEDQGTVTHSEGRGGGGAGGGVIHLFTGSGSLSRFVEGTKGGLGYNGNGGNGGNGYSTVISGYSG